GVPHSVALVGFDSEAKLLENFTPDINAIAAGLHDLEPGDSGAAIYVALKFPVGQLQKHPPEYRRAVVLVSETVDRGSHTALEDTVRSVSDTNTVIYTFAFSSTKSAARHEAGQVNSAEPGPAGGGFSGS